VKAIVPSEPKQVVGLVAVPAVKVGDAGSVKVFVADDVPVQPPAVTENPENVPSGKLPKVNAPLTTVIFCGLPEPV
jgi:hypothetical protein